MGEAGTGGTSAGAVSSPYVRTTNATTVGDHQMSRLLPVKVASVLSACTPAKIPWEKWFPVFALHKGVLSQSTDGGCENSATPMSKSNGL